MSRKPTVHEIRLNVANHFFVGRRTASPGHFGTEVPCFVNVDRRDAMGTVADGLTQECSHDWFVG